MYELLRSGALGNTLENYSSIQELCMKSKYRGRCGIRTVGIPGGLFIPNVKFGCLQKTIATHFSKVEYNVSPMIKVERHLLQGELYNDWLTYSHEPLLFREAMSKAKVSNSCLLTRSLLTYYLDEPSYENIRRLQEEYPDHVIEFLCVRGTAGIFDLNTIIWEVRNY